MPRLLFQKTGNAIWISHLDLMRLFQRSFKRAGLQLTHTQGFNPRPSVSIALPLSVGTESYCELLDFELDGQNLSCREVMERLNVVLVPGVCVTDAYQSGQKLKELAFLKCLVTLEYDGGIPDKAECEISDLFARTSVIVDKKSKNGISEQNIIPMIQTIEVSRRNDKVLEITSIICCQNPTLNPAQLCSAIGKYLPHCRPDFYKCTRLELYDKENKVFR